MLKKVTACVKRMIMSPFVLYTYNLISAPIGLTVPINLFTVGSVFVFGLPGLFGLVVLLKFLS